ncbi:MAG: lipopolysaccharide biosynthesis protein [Curtobacterium sp.]
MSGADRRPNGLVRLVGGAAAVKVGVMVVSGLLGIVTSRLILSSYGTDAYAQYGLLSTITTLLPFADLGIAAVLINTIAGSDHPRTDDLVRRTLTTAIRVLLSSGAVIVSIGAVITLAGWWPALLGHGLLPGSGPIAAFLCLTVFGLVLPLGVGSRILVGLQKNTTQLAVSAVVAPFIFLIVGSSVLLTFPLGGYLAVVSYAANALSSVICVILAARLLSPQVRAAIRDVPRIRTVPGVKVMRTAWPMLAQMLALPIAMQTDRLLLSHLTTGDQLAQYNLASQLFGIILQTVAAAGLALWPIYAKARARSDIRSPNGPTTVFALGGLGLATALALVSPWLVQVVSSGRLQLDGWLVWGFVVFATVQAAKYPIGMYMTDDRGLRFQVLPILILVPLNLGLSWWLVGIIGAGGTIVGSTVAVVLCQVIPNLLYVRHDLRRRRAAVLAPENDVLVA